MTSPACAGIHRPQLRAHRSDAGLTLDDQKPDSQRTALKRWLNGNGILENVQWFEDTETGATTKRPAFEAMQGSVFAGEINTIVVWNLDRISRNHKDGIILLADGAIAAYASYP